MRRFLVAVASAVLVLTGFGVPGVTLADPVTGTVVGWGDNFFGQTTPPAGLPGVVAIAAGDFYSLALKADGTVVGWGEDDHGEASFPAGLTGVVAIAAGNYHGLALKADGTVVGWGFGQYGADVPPGLTDVVAIDLGLHGLALKADGTVVGWGHNAYGQATPPAGLTGAVAIGARAHDSLALKADGTVVAWGYNAYGQADVPAGLTGVVAIAAGGYHNLALVHPYDFAGFFQPIDNLVWNTAKAGQAIPIKFSLAGDQGLGLFAPGFPKAVGVACPDR